ncbi:MAG: AsmA-like C-terminal domain-containing protein [Deltaproteobacteria bacterium]
MGKKTKIPGALALSILIIVAALVMLSAFLASTRINLSPYHQGIESAIKTKTGIDVKLSGIALKALPTPYLELKGLKVSYAGHPMLEVSDARAKVAFLPLLANRLVIRDLRVDNAAFFINRDIDGRINIVEFLRLTVIRPELMGLRLSGARVFLSDKMTGAAPVEVDVSAEVKKGPGKNTFFSLGARIKRKGEIYSSGEIRGSLRDISGQAVIKDIDIGAIAPYLKNTGIKIQGGRLSAVSSYGSDKNGFTIHDAAINYRDLSLGYAGKAQTLRSKNGSANLMLNYSDDGFKVSLSALNLLIDDITVKGSLLTQGPFSDMAYKASISTTPIRPDALLKHVAASKPIGKDVAAISSAEGTVSVDLLEAEGRINDLINGRAAGALKTANLSLNNIGFSHSAYKKRFSGFSGIASIKGNSIFFKGITGSYGNVKADALNGVITDFTGAALSDLAIKTRFDLSGAHGLVEDFSAKKDVSGRAGDGLKKISASGPAVLLLNIKGPLKGPVGPDYSGVLSIKNAAIKHPAALLRLEAATGDIEFNRKKISIKGLSGVAGRSRINISGGITDYLEDKAVFDIAARATVFGDDVLKAYPDILGLDAKGPIVADARILGTADELTMDIAADLTRTAFTYKNILSKGAGKAFSAKATVLKNTSGLRLMPLIFNANDSQIAIEGVASNGFKTYDVSVKAPSLALKDLSGVSAFLSPDHAALGAVSVEFNARKNDPSSAPSYSGEISLKTGSLKPLFLARPVVFKNLFAKFSGNSASLAIESLESGKSRVSLKARSPDISGRVFDFEISSDLFDTADFFGSEEKRAARAPEDKKAIMPFSVKGRVLARNGSLWGHKFKELSASVNSTDGSVYFSPLSLELDKGRVSGSIAIHLDSKKEHAFDLGLALSEVDFETMLGAFGAKGRVLSGPVSGSIELWGKKGAGPFLGGINGKARIYSKEGKLWEFLFLSKIFSIVNIVSIGELFKEGLPYRHLTGDFSVMDGVISSGNLYLDSDSLRMSAAGDIDAVNATIDGYLAMHPFVTIDKIISRVPIAGWIITGEKKSAISMYFSIEGPLNDPKTEPAPVVSIGKNIYDVLERLVETPFELLIPR